MGPHVIGANPLEMVVRFHSLGSGMGTVCMGVTTLGSCTEAGEGVVALGFGGGEGCSGFLAVRFEKNSARFLSAAVSLVSSGDSGEAECGDLSAWTMSCARARMVSALDGYGMRTWVGNQAKVSAMRSALVSNTQTL